MQQQAEKGGGGRNVSVWSFESEEGSVVGGPESQWKALLGVAQQFRTWGQLFFPSIFLYLHMYLPALQRLEG